MAFRVVTVLPGDGVALAATIREVLFALARGDARLMGENPLPDVYSSGIEFRPEPQEGNGTEYWDDPWTTYRRGWGDCDDIVRWRLATLLATGVSAAPVVAWVGDVFHVLIRHPNGATEDPSRVLLERQRRRAG